MKSTYVYVVLSLIILYLLISTVTEGKQFEDWSENYHLYKDEPFSASVFREVVTAYPEIEDVYVYEESLADLDLRYYENDQHMFFFLNTRLVFEKDIPDKLIEFVRDGNDVFLGANYFDTFLLQEIGVDIGYAKINLQDTTYVNFLNDTLENNSTLLKTKDARNTSYYFDSIPSTAEILGYSKDKKPNFIRHKIENNYLYLHTNPKAFTNLNMLRDPSNQYAADVFNEIKRPIFIFDNYYKGNYQFKNEGSSMFSYIYDNTQLNIAYLIAIVLILLFLIFNTRRNQSIMPSYHRSKNKSKEFAETIAQLYYNRKDNKSIAKIEIKYFMAHLRESYHYHQLTLNKDLAEEVAYQSGCDKTLIIKLFNTIIRINRTIDISNDELILLTRLIKEYHTKRN